MLGASLATFEERLAGKPRIPPNRLELLYRIDPLVFPSIERLVQGIITRWILLNADPNDIAEIEAFLKRIKFRKHAIVLVRDALITGNGFVEIVYTKDGKDIFKLMPLDPKKMDYQRTGQDNVASQSAGGYVYSKIKLDEFGEPVGYVQFPGDFVVKKNNLPRDHVLHVTFYHMGDNLLGISMLEPLYKAIVIRMNIEEALGESIYRHGFPIWIGKVGNEKNPRAPRSAMEKLGKDLKEIQNKAYFVFPPNITIEKLEASDMKIGEQHVEYFRSTITKGLDVPLQGDPASPDFEKKISFLQTTLAEQVTEQLIEVYARIKKLKTIPEFSFEERVPETKLSSARRLGLLSRSRLINWSPETEEYLRKTEGLPLSPDGTYLGPNYPIYQEFPHGTARPNTPKPGAKTGSKKKESQA